MQHVSSPALIDATPVSYREADDAYADVVAIIDADCRVINCKDDLQWIVQRRSGNQWRSQAFCRQRVPLIRLLEWDGKQSTPLPREVRKVLEGLPAIHP